MPYGQSIPPKYVQSSLLRPLTKAAYAQLLAQTLARVGMKFNVAMSDYDILNPAFEQHHRDYAINTEYVFVFDFPTVETFLIGTVTYRPCVMLSHGEGSADLTSNEIGDQVSLYLAARRSDRSDAPDLRTYHYQRNNTNAWGMGNANDSSGVAGVIALEGARYLRGGWLPAYRPTFANYPTTPGMTVANIQYISCGLGPGGLFLTTSNDGVNNPSAFHAFAVIFFGERIPGRGLPPLSDTPLTRTNPTFMYPMRTSDGEFVGDPVGAGAYRAHVLGHILGAEYDRHFPSDPLAPIHFYLHNLVNIERPLAPRADLSVFSSPRLVGPSGRHILEPIVATPWVQRGQAVTPLNIYNRYDPNVDTGFVTLQQSDVFYAPGCRVTDRNAPVGLYADPDTNIDWFLVDCPARSLKFAFNMDNAVNVTNAAIPTPSLVLEEAYDISPAGFATTAPPLPRALTTHSHRVGSGTTIGEDWLAVGATNAMQSATLWRSANAFNGIAWAINWDPATTDPEEILEIRFDAFARTTGATMDWASFQVFMLSNNRVVNGSADGGPLLAVVPGNGAGINGHDLATYTLRIPCVQFINQSSGTLTGFATKNKAVIWFRNVHRPTTHAGTQTCRVENVRLRRLKR